MPPVICPVVNEGSNMNARRKSPRSGANESEAAYIKIKELILRGKAEPGEIVSILYFSQLLKIGRTPVTSACQKLEAEGMLRILPKKGVLISPLTISDVRDLYEAREAIEVYVGERAFPNITASDTEELRQCIERQKEMAEREDAYGFMTEDAYFHKYILQRYPNQTLLNLYDMMNDRIFIVGVMNSKSPARIRESIREHEEIVDAIVASDKAHFLRVLSKNILRGYCFMAGIEMPERPVF